MLSANYILMLSPVLGFVILNLTVDAVYLRTPNISKWRELRRREKRTLIFPIQNILKYRVTLSTPLNLGDKKNWRTLTTIHNLHFEYPLPQTPASLYENFWLDDRRRAFSDRNRNTENTTESTADNITQDATANTTADAIDTDETQLLVYKIFEEYMYEKGNNGSACLQRAICMNAQADAHGGLYAEIVDRILIPHRNLGVEYTDARAMGKFGVDCDEAFPYAKDCLTDKYLIFHDEIFEDEPQTLPMRRFRFDDE